MKGEIEIQHVHAFIRTYQMTLDDKNFGGASIGGVV
jgi:hypothetical protein